jgi:hypothetical protein
MGFDENRFNSSIDSEFICAICQDVIENPVMTPKCEHIFCKKCITKTFAAQESQLKRCPNDRIAVYLSQLTQPHRTFTKFYSNLEIKCGFESNGCQTYSKINYLKLHESLCKFDSKRKTLCDKQCGAVISGAQYKTHDCVTYLKAIIADKDKELKNLRLLLRDSQTLSQNINVFRFPIIGTKKVNFFATLGTDAIMKNGFWNLISTKHQCITFMAEYKNKSFEELRFEDYIYNRK